MANVCYLREGGLRAGNQEYQQNDDPAAKNGNLPVDISFIDANGVPHTSPGQRAGFKTPKILDEALKERFTFRLRARGF